MSECLKHEKPSKECMKYAIISHNIDFVTFLMNEYNIKINDELISYGEYRNLESFLVCFDQTNDINQCFVYSAMFGITSLCEYFILHGAKVNKKDEMGDTALHYAAKYNYTEIAELLLSHRAKINEKDKDRKRALHFAAECNNKEIVELLLSRRANKSLLVYSYVI